MKPVRALALLSLLAPLVALQDPEPVPEPAPEVRAPRGLTGADGEPVDEHDLAWLSGHWRSESPEEGYSEELWTAPEGRMLLGLNRSGSGERPASFEYLRIERRSPGVLVYVAQPGGASPTEFTLVELTEKDGVQGAVFLNPTHDFPQRIEYQREGDVLRARVGTQQRPTGIGFEWKRR